MRPKAKWWEWLGGIALVAVGAAARFSAWSEVFVRGHVALMPSDSHYYIRFALRQLAHFPRFDSFDPYVNAPTGADIIWPPLHTCLVALGILLGGRNNPELGAALVDPVLGTIELAILGVVAFRLYDSRTALFTLAFYAVLPAIVNYSLVGSCDHHVHEPFFLALICLMLGRVLTDGSRNLAIATGVVLGSVRLFTPIAPMIVVIAAVACLAVATMDASHRFSRLAIFVGGSAAAVLVPSVVVFGHVHSLGYESLSTFQPLFVLSLFLGVGAVAMWRSGDRRAWMVLLVALAAAAPLVAELLRAAGHMGRKDPLLEVVEESKPLSLQAAWFGFSVAMVLVPVAIFGAMRLYRRRNFEAVPALLATVMLIPPAMYQMRFTMMLSGAVVILIAQAVPEALANVPKTNLVRNGVAAAACALMWFNSTAARGDLDVSTRTFKPTLDWMRDHLPPASDDGPMGDAKARYAIVANPFLGHQAMLWSEKPVVGTPFSQAPVHVAGNERVAHVFSATSDADTYAAMVATEGRYLIASARMQALGHPEVNPLEAYVGWLFRSAGLGPPSTGHFRLLYRSVEPSSMVADASALEVFEAVKGALLEGKTTPSAVVTASIDLIDNLGTRRTYTRSVRAALDGYFKIRVPYPSEDASHALVAPPPEVRAYTVKTDTGAVDVAVSVYDIMNGKTIMVPPGI